MKKDQSKTVSYEDNMAFVKEQNTDLDIKNVFFAANPMPGANMERIEADLKAFLAIKEAFKNQKSRRGI